MYLLRVYTYHNGELNECIYVAVTTSLLYMRAGLGTNVMVMSVCNSSVMRKKSPFFGQHKVIP